MLRQVKRGAILAGVALLAVVLAAPAQAQTYRAEKAEDPEDATVTLRESWRLTRRSAYVGPDCAGGPGPRERVAVVERRDRRWEEVWLVEDQSEADDLYCTGPR
jgi:hypothetical protein